MNTTQEQNPQVVASQPEALEAPIISPLHIPEPQSPLKPATGNAGLEVVLIVISSLSVVGLLYWKREMIQSISPYGTLVIPSIIALGQLLFKDWKNYHHRWVRGALVTMVVAACAWGILYQIQQQKLKIEAEEHSAQQQAASAARAQTAEKAQRDNTLIFQNSFDKLTTKIAELETKVATKELQDELAETKKELAKTQTLLAGPAPVQLMFSLWPFKNPPGQKLEAFTQTTLPVDSDGNVHVEFTVLNPTERPASDGELTLVICDQCKFTKEPTQFQKMDGDRETRRLLAFSRMLPLTNIPKMSADITVPATANQIQIGMIMKCTNCLVSSSTSVLTVQLARDFVRPFPKK